MGQLLADSILTFQSAPPTEVRGDEALGSIANPISCFNPLPPPK